MSKKTKNIAVNERIVEELKIIAAKKKMFLQKLVEEILEKWIKENGEIIRDENEENDD